MVAPVGAPDRVVYALRRAYLAVEAAKEERLRPTGVTPAHYAALITINNRPGLTGAELARLLGVTAQNVTGLVARLTDRGLVERLPDPRHPHVLEIHLTAQGRDRLRAADAAVEGLEADVVAHLGPRNTAAARALLGSLVDLGR